ncbi:hypothetical protein GMDG_03700 [Pseudogymnoascus destructans 20631-21]|uniref:PD-(D/E)XK nuclease-like domain-containing protein n=1 Tax=Pseudogymnoascus destructans (strain ATCC MYA-4855 / 20631-21) TaxID=658429 RepID=L8G7E3_PSED2|nr:hypothetical protein GMDG_03700 [Pseudogymnoascus destructans 20631-21]
MKNNGEKAASEKHAFILDLYKELQDSILVGDQLVHVLIAGRDTTACLMSWEFFLLVRHPEALTRIRDEIQTITGGSTGFTRAHINRMKYLRCVINESHTANKASIQLGVWCCAGLLKLHELRLQQGDIDTEETVPLIGMTAIGLDWKSHVAYKLPDDGAVVSHFHFHTLYEVEKSSADLPCVVKVILGPVSIGGYEDIHNFFVLNSVFKIIAKWAEQDYWTHFREPAFPPLPTVAKTHHSRRYRVSGAGRSPSLNRYRNIKTYLGLQKNKKETDDKTQTRSFSPSDIFWPEEYLVPDLPQARIWTYGYNADVIGGLFQANNQNSISQHGRDFAVRLERDIDNEDPIVFVAHSLGGIITKDIGDNLQTDKADCLSWDTTSRKHILEVNDEVLDNIQDEFKTILSNCAIKVHSFQEAKGISGMKGLDSKVVDNFSSKLDLAREQETVETIDVNHMEMARCGSRDDVCYRQICGVLKQFIRETNSANNNSLAKQFIVPFPQDKHFVGREDILGQLDLGGEQEEPKKHQRHALVGLGGVGKSQIAIEYAYRARKCQPQISVFWIQASTKTRFEQAYKEMAERLEIPGRDNPKANVLQLVYNWLSDEANGQWHMILDNVDDGSVFFGNYDVVRSVSQYDHAMDSQLPLEMFLPQS